MARDPQISGGDHETGTRYRRAGGAVHVWLLRRRGEATGGPTLSTALKHSCFGWPAKEFTTANYAGWSTAVKAGQTAIELNLKDTSGKAYSLSGLLATRPVWMQFGSYT